MKHFLSRDQFLWIEYGKYCDGKIENELAESLYSFLEWKKFVYSFENYYTYKNYVSDESKKISTKERHGPTDYEKNIEI